jgi:phage protein D
VLEKYVAPAFRLVVDGAELDEEAARTVMEISVVQQADRLDELTVVLANPFPELPWTHGPHAAKLREGSAVQARLGYRDDLHPVFDGEVTTLGPVFPGSGVPVLRVEARTRMHRLQGAVRSRTFKDVTDAEVVEKVCGELALTPKTDPTSARHPYVVQYNQTDLAFLADRARRVGFELRVDGKELHFRKAGFGAGKRHTLSWGLGKGSGAGADVLPLRAFAPALELQGQVSEVVVRGLDPKTREPIEGKAAAGSEDSTMGGKQTGSQASKQAFGESRLLVVDHPVSTPEEAEALAKAIFNDRALGFVQGSGEAVGLPQLRAGEVVQIDGLGERFSGEYYLARCIHTFDRGGFRTRFDVKRNSIG